jgi:nucleolar complex protein 2
MSTDGSLLDIVSKALYLSLVRASKNTTPHTLPSITLMKNSASEIYCLDSATAYQHAFGYIRQLAIHLRNSMKVKTKVWSS